MATWNCACCEFSVGYAILFQLKCLHPNPEFSLECAKTNTVSAWIMCASVFDSQQNYL